jgi:hypothetical protein
VDLAKKLGVVLGKLEDASAHFLQKHGNSLLCVGVTVVFGALPSRLHHPHEVLIARQVHRDVRVVINPLGLGNHSVVVAACSVEIVQEIQ